MPDDKSRHKSAFHFSPTSFREHADSHWRTVPPGTQLYDTIVVKSALLQLSLTSHELDTLTQSKRNLT